MLSKKTRFILLVVITVMFFLTGCSNNTQISVDNNIDKITVSLVKATKSDLALYLYLDVKNESPYDIIQNRIFMSHPIKTDIGSMGNKYKIEINDRIFKVAAGETIRVSTIIPYDSAVNTDALILDTVEYKIEGYFDNISNETSYFKQEPLFLNNGE